MRDYITKLHHILKSSGLVASFRWSKIIHRKIIWICIVSTVYTLVSLYSTLGTKYLIDSTVSEDLNGIRCYSFILFTIILLQHSLNVIRTHIKIKASAALQKSLQSLLVEQILGKQYAALKSYHSGELVNRLFSDISVVKGGIMNILPNLLGCLVSFLGAAIILISMDWHFVILMVVGGILGVVLMLLFKKPLKERHKRMQEAGAALHAAAQETLENVRLIKASSSESRAEERVHSIQDSLAKEQIEQGLFRFRMDNSMGAVFSFSWLFCMIWGCLSIYHGRLTYGSLTAMVQLIGRIQGPISSAVSIASQTYSMTSSAERILELTSLKNEEQSEELNDFDEIRLENLTFHYDDSSEDILQSVNWNIKRGDFLALTGMSGEGKTSLFHLLLGIYKPTEGQILFCNGDKIVPVSRGTRKPFAYVPQGNTLFSGTIRENLKMFTDTATDEELMVAA